MTTEQQPFEDVSWDDLQWSSIATVVFWREKPRSPPQPYDPAWSKSPLVTNPAHRRKGEISSKGFNKNVSDRGFCCNWWKSRCMSIKMCGVWKSYQTSAWKTWYDMIAEKVDQRVAFQHYRHWRVTRTPTKPVDLLLTFESDSLCNKAKLPLWDWADVTST